jgi:hypothetical protein
LVKFEKAKKRMACQALSRKKLRKRNKICKRNDDARDKCTVSTVSIYFNNVEIFFHFAIRVWHYLINVFIVFNRTHATIGVNGQGINRKIKLILETVSVYYHKRLLSIPVQYDRIFARCMLI